MRSTQLLAVGTIAALTAIPAMAQESRVPVDNYRFDLVDVGLDAGDPFPFVTGDPIGWEGFTETSPGIVDLAVAPGNFTGVIDPAGSIYFNPGTYNQECGLIFLSDASQPVDALPVGLRQITSTTLQAGVRYRLYVSVGNIQTDPDYDFDLGGFPGYATQLAIGDTILVEDNDSLLIAEGEFAQSVIEFEAPPGHPLLGQNIEIRLLNLNQPIVPDGQAGAEVGREVDFDNVWLTVETIPPRKGGRR